MRNLYELTDQYREAWHLFENEEIESRVVIDTLEGLEGEIELKVKNVAAFILNLKGEEDMVKAALRRMDKRYEGIVKRREALQEYLLMNLKKCEFEEIKTPDFVVKLGKCPASVIVKNENLLPAQYIKEEVVKKIDKIALKKDLSEGKVIEGAELETNKMRLIIK